MVIKSLPCPYCGNNEPKRTLNSWVFALYDVTRFQCEKCDGKFNSYELDGELKYTIPRTSKWKS